MDEEHGHQRGAGLFADAWSAPSRAAVDGSNALSARRALAPVMEASARLHQEMLCLWDGVPSPATRRDLVAAGFCLVTRQHALGQFHLVSTGLDVSAATLVRPSFESLVRALWVLNGAEDNWVEGFLAPSQDAISSDRETRMGPPVDSMLATIRLHYPGHVSEPLAALKEHTWRGMHSYVHGGIRAVAQAMGPTPEHELAGMLMNANTMLGMATHVFRAACGVATPELPALLLEHADCFPPH